MKPATLAQVSQLLKFVQDQGLGSSHVQALIRTGCFADICEAAKQGSLARVDRTNFRKCIGLLPQGCDLATIEELLALGEAYPELQREFIVVALVPVPED